MKKLVLFGNNSFTRLMKWYIDNDDEREIIAVTVEKAYITDDEFEGLPVIPFEELEETYSVDEIEILICVGYSKMNNIRMKIFTSCKEKGYTIAQYIHSSALISGAQLGEGNIILEQTLIEPFVVVGDCNLIWYNVSIAHDCVIGDFNTITGKSSLCGFVKLGNNCFIGNSAIIRDKVVVHDYTLVGAAAYIARDTEEYSVVVPAKSVVLQDKRSTDFF